jgi:hypothetical protein
MRQDQNIIEPFFRMLNYGIPELYYRAEKTEDKALH